MTDDDGKFPWLNFVHVIILVKNGIAVIFVDIFARRACSFYSRLLYEIMREKVEGEGRVKSGIKNGM